MTVTQENKGGESNELPEAQLVDEVQETTNPFAGMSQKAYKFLPLYLLVPILYWAVFKTMGYELNWKGFGLGALGWTVALFLRGPLSLLVQKWPPERAKIIIISSSGVFEEGVRLTLLVLTSVSFTWAQSVGQGWAAIEVLFVIINVIMITALIKRTDEKAMQAKEMLVSQGNLQASPLWGILERIWSSAYHIGATLIIAHSAWAIVLLIPLHSGLNIMAVRISKASIFGASMFVAVVGLVTLAVGLLTM